VRQGIGPQLNVHGPRLAALAALHQPRRAIAIGAPQPAALPARVSIVVARFTVSELVDMGLASLAEIFDLSLDRMKRDLVTSQAINWGNDPFARGAYSYATPKTREAQLALRKPDGGAVFFSGEALYAGRDMGTVEAALPSGREAAQTILAAGR
jgi:monoamine oxidase